MYWKVLQLVRDEWMYSIWPFNLDKYQALTTAIKQIKYHIEYDEYKK